MRANTGNAALEELVLLVIMPSVGERCLRKKLFVLLGAYKTQVWLTENGFNPQSDRCHGWLNAGNDK